MNRFFFLAIALLCSLPLAATRSLAQPTSQPATQSTQRTVRVAVIGGMNDTGFWDAIAKRFEAATGIRVVTTTSGPKDGITPIFKQGKTDLITMHSSDMLVNLVADGWARDLQPWARNDMIIVGPANDPAKIKGMTDAAGALKKIVASKSLFIVHSSLGAQEVLRNILDAHDIELDPDHTEILLEDRQRRVLSIAAEKSAYTMIGRIPFLSGKIPNAAMEVMVAGDEALRRPFMVAVANPEKVKDAHVSEAHRLAEFLRSPRTQQFIAEFGKGKYDDRSLFSPVDNPSHFASASTEPGTQLTVCGDVLEQLSLDADALAKFPQHQAKVTDRDGKPITFAGPLVADILKQAGVPIGSHKMRGLNLTMYLSVEASDGYRAVFSLADFDEDFIGKDAQRQIILATTRDGKPLTGNEGSLRLIVPMDKQPTRWVRKVVTLRVDHDS